MAGTQLTALHKLSIDTAAPYKADGVEPQPDAKVLAPAAKELQELTLAGCHWANLPVLLAACSSTLLSLCLAFHHIHPTHPAAAQLQPLHTLLQHTPNLQCLALRGW